MGAIVVINAIAGLVKEDLPAISVLRLFGVLKMVRLFRSMTQLRIMIDALYSAILPVANAFMLLLLLSTIYAIVGTDLFKDLAPEYFGRSQALLLAPLSDHSLICHQIGTDRRRTCSFIISLFTFVECATESWAVAARTVMGNPASPYNQHAVTFFSFHTCSLWECSS
jgi:uncharacterized membrane protein YcfT